MIGELKLDDAIPFSKRLAIDVAERLVEAAERAADEDKNDPIRAIIKAYNEMDEEMMRVVDAHIERIRKSSERNKELYRKLALKKEIEKRQEIREELFNEAANKAQAMRDSLRMRSN